MPYTEIVPQLIDANEISDFLARPYLIADGNFTSSMAFNQTLASGLIESYLNSVSLWQRKLAGYRYIRATAHLRLTVNANPFQQGKLILAVLPCVQQHNFVGSTYETSHTINLCQVTQLPNVELDIQETTATLSVPFVAPVHFHDRTASIPFGWGKFYVKVLCPFATGTGSDNCEWSLFLHFADVELSGPIFGPEGGVSKPANARIVRERRKVAKTGAISSFLENVSQASGYLTNIPILGSAASMVSSAAGSFADAFSVFGWAKPLTSQVGQVVSINPLHQFLNHDGESKAMPMSLGHNPILPIVSNFGGTELDEMSLAYLKTVEAFIENFGFNTSNVTEQTLFTRNISPASMGLFTTVTVGGTEITYKSSPPAFHLANYFRYYRGGIKIKFKLVKTPYHSGRIVVSFNVADAELSINQAAYVLREIIDIKTTNEFTIIVPYIRKTNYLDTRATSVDDSLGRLTVKVLNELRAPDTASNFISVLVYASAADDYELAYPSVALPAFCPEGGYQVEGGDVQPLNDNVIGSLANPTSEITPNIMSIGDPFVSIKQLLTVYRQLAFPQTTVKKNMYLWPFALSTMRATDTYTLTSSPRPFVGDYLSELSSGYVLSRGSVRYFIPNGTAATIYSSRLLSPPYVGNIVFYDDQVIPSSSNVLVKDITGRQFHCAMASTKNGQWGTEVLVPHYGRTPARLNYLNVSVIPETADANKCTLAIGVDVGNASQHLNNIYRAGGDDYVFGYFIGFAPVISLITYPD